MADFVTKLLRFTTAAEPNPGQDDVEFFKQWTPILQPLVQATGYWNGVFGRSADRPSDVLVITLWKSQDAYSQFTSSIEGKAFFSNLTQLSQDVPQSYAVRFFERDLRFRSMGGIERAAAEIHTIDFPLGSRESIGKRLNTARGMADRYGHGINYSDPEIAAKIPSKSLPLCGWVEFDETQRRELNCDRAIWIHTWKSSEFEMMYKKNKVATLSGFFTDDEGNKAPVLPVEQVFEKRLQMLGSTSIVSEHCNLQKIART